MLPDADGPANVARPLGPVIMDLATTTVSEHEQHLLQSPHVGGLIFFARNFQSVPQLEQLIRQIRSIRPDLLLMVDQEGGRVQRFKEGFTRLPPLQTLGKLFEQAPEKARELAADHAWVMASELIYTGVDLSLAPILDADDHFSAVIGDRAFSRDFHTVSDLASAYIAGMNQAGMVATAKHFPGHGSVQADSHLSLPVDSRTLAQVEQEDLIPFVQCLHQYAAIMPAHIIFEQADSHPVGFSRYWLQTVLRGQLGFDGVIFSDDLSMEGAAFAGDYCQRAAAALNAGCDAILVCNHPDEAESVIRFLDSFAYTPSPRLAALSCRSAQKGAGLDKLKAGVEWQQRSASLSLLKE